MYFIRIGENMKTVCSVCNRKSEFITVTGSGCEGPVCGYCNPHDNKTYKYWLKANNVRIKPIEDVPAKRPRITHFKHKCLDCGNEYETYISLVRKKIGEGKLSCHVCDQKRRAKECSDRMKGVIPNQLRKSHSLSFTDYKQVLKERGIKCLEKGYLRDSMRHQCLVCGSKFSNYYTNILFQGNGCAACAGCKKKTTESYKKQLYAIQANIFEVVGEYRCAKTPIAHRCTKCKNIRTMSPDNCLRKYHSRCLFCTPGYGSFKRKHYELDGETILVQGFENHALDYLKGIGIPEDWIVTAASGNVPTITYKAGGTRLHRPDIFIPNKNYLIEVKSLWTLGMHKPNASDKGKSRAKRWTEQCLKAKAGIRAGFKYSLLVMTASGERLKLPKDWYDYKFREMFNLLESQYRLPG